MRILVACEYSGIVRDAFRDMGHDAWSCDIIPTEGDPDYHIQGDVLDFLGGDWDMMIAHPPCTYLANSGVRWLTNEDGTANQQRYNDMVKAKNFFRELLNADIPKIAIENPIQHKYGKVRQQDQLIQPWMFGENESKAVCLWLKGLPKLIPNVTEKPDNLDQRVWRMPPSPDRQKERSRFFKGIAKAMAEQWGN